MTSHSEIASTSVERLQHHDHRLPGFADALAESAGLPLGEIEALETAQRSFTRIIASLDDPTVLLALPHTLWPTLESCFETGLDPGQCEAVLAAARAYFYSPSFR